MRTCGKEKYLRKLLRTMDLMTHSIQGARGLFLCLTSRLAMEPMSNGHSSLNCALRALMKKKKRKYPQNPITTLNNLTSAAKMNE